MSQISFEEIMFTIMAATQDTFKTYLGLEIYAGKVEKKVDPVDSDIVGIVGVAGDRVGYIILGAAGKVAFDIAKSLLMMDEPDEEAIRDAIGELTNNIAGVFKTRYHEEFGNVALGLPLIVSGKIRPIQEERSSMNVQCKGVTIPFKSLDGVIALRVMVYM
ncbi:chemotaxis protein CheX [Geobacter sp. DSM 9736]|uniref:chemotaxis protein CheX n=1 Tax=Geobacter sp. DSM 9736 TaxID=1277350 RepID=UPI000B50A2CF|nr:chemotaxis protein CheX [Geobacter sp. DSM 9736]SNB46579.1 Chemotaxis protein CheX, a CheY~P-specific phosphatase [Geobacter sp. DSM 9736]